MKYKIGELEVEAIQWTGEDRFQIISDFLDTIKFGLYGIERDKKDNITIEDEGSQKIAFLEVGEYLVSSETSLFKLSEQDFNKIATKVKEPKFKVGDIAYWLSEDCEGLSLDKKEVQEIIRDQDFGFVYDVGALSLVKEKYLFTLEEAIEKLKEL